VEAFGHQAGVGVFAGFDVVLFDFGLQAGGVEEGEGGVGVAADGADDDGAVVGADCGDAVAIEDRFVREEDVFDQFGAVVFAGDAGERGADFAAVVVDLVALDAADAVGRVEEFFAVSASPLLAAA